jgi:hypothetical protein
VSVTALTVPCLYYDCFLYAFDVMMAMHLCLTGLIPLYIYSRKHPQNLIILAAWVRSLLFGGSPTLTALDCCLCIVAQSMQQVQEHGNYRSMLVFT